LNYLEQLAAILQETSQGVTDITDKRVSSRKEPAPGTDETEKFVNTRTTTGACRSVPYLEKTAGETPQAVTDKTDISPFVHPSVGSVGYLPRHVYRESVLFEASSDNRTVHPAKTANLLKSAEAGASAFSRLAALAASQDPAKAFEAEKSSPQVEIAQTDNHGVRPAKLPENEPNFSRLAALAAPPVPASFFDHRCSVCGQPARFGYDVYLRRGEEGRWFCAAHRPEVGRA
jgi:hypothetical protein